MSKSVNIEGEVWTEDQLSRRLTHSMHAGERSAAKSFSSYLLKKSGEQFQLGRDDAANLLRNLSKEVTSLFYDPADKLCQELSESPNQGER